MKKNLLYLCMLALVLSACSENDPEKDGGGGGNQGGQRTYLPIGWFDNGSLENTVAGLTSSMVAFGDYQGVVNEINELYWEGCNGIHVVDKNTFEWAVGGATTQRPSNYYATQYFGNNITCYFFYAYANATYEYKIVDNILYFKDEEYDIWDEIGEVTVSGNTIKFGNDEYQKVNYGGGYEWDN